MAGHVRGRNLLDTTDLPQIPPFNGQLALKYRLAGFFSTEISANLYADQNKIASGEKPSKGYASYDFGIYSDPVKIWNIRFEAFGGIQNITDRAYMNHLSTNRGIIKYEPGRNFYLKLRFSF
jgi:outer membrane receptor protein involved in Fe transport